jgi:hypothetical protein
MLFTPYRSFHGDRADITVVARVYLDVLRSRQSRREEPMTADAPEPVATGTPGSSPEQEALLADSVGLALLVVLDRLTPAERLAFVLHDMFNVPFEAIVDGKIAEIDVIGNPERLDEPEVSIVD